MINNQASFLNLLNTIKRNRKQEKNSRLTTEKNLALLPVMYGYRGEEEIEEEKDLAFFDEEGRLNTNFTCFNKEQFMDLVKFAETFFGDLK